MPSPLLIKAHPVTGGEQPIPETFDPTWEYECWADVDGETYLAMCDRLIELAHETLPPGTRFVLKFDDGGDSFCRFPPAIGFYYGPQFALMDDWEVSKELPRSLNRVGTKSNAATGIFAHWIA